MHKLTKIVATIGPASDTPDSIASLIKAGVDVFRFNFKHNEISWHAERMTRVKKAAGKSGSIIGTLLDLQGPEIRLRIKNKELRIKNGEEIIIGENSLTEEIKGFTISHPEILPSIKTGQKLLADDGNFVFEVIKEGNSLTVKSHSDGVLLDRKSLNIPGADFPFPVLTERDYSGLDLAKENTIDFIALSFVRSGQDIEILRKEMAKRGLAAKIIAKIETKKALDNIDEIIGLADGIMVARGDLGVELPASHVPFYQKRLIRKCVEKGIPVITATQMLQSMVINPSPTRAEVSDVANAVYDFTDAVMLSGETAAGAHPLKSVQVMAETASFNEKQFFDDIRKIYDFCLNDEAAVICDTAYNLFMQSLRQKETVAAFMVFTATGKTAQLLARYRPNVPVFAMVPDSTVAGKLTAGFGIFPIVLPHFRQGEAVKEAVEEGLRYMEKKGHFKKHDQIIMLHGEKWGQVGGTNTIKVIEI